MSKVFCPSCGNKTLKRVTCTVNEDGTRTIYLSKRPLNLKGTNYALPKPRGGKHPNNPHLYENQPIPHERLPKKALQKTDALNVDYLADGNPFSMNDVVSKGSSLGRGRGGGRSDADTRAKHHIKGTKGSKRK